MMKEHIIFEKIELLKQILSDKKSKEEIGEDTLQFLTISVEYIESRLESTIPVLVQDSDLITASTELNKAIAELNNYLGNKNTGHLTNFRNSMLASINRIRLLPFPISRGGFSFSNEIESFKNIISEKKSELDQEVNSLINQVGDLERLIGEKKQKLDELESKLELKNKEIADLNKNFEDQYDKDRAEFIEIIGNLENQIKSKSDELVNYLEKKKIEASKIVNIIGNIGVTGNFQKNANDHKTVANIWRVVAIIFMAGLSGLVIYSVLSLGGENYDWTKSIIRVIGAAILSYPATYAARESSKHRKLENYNRKLELELSSIEAFIELLPAEKKQSIKEKLSEKYFGSTLDLFDDVDLKSDKDFSLQAIERVVKVIEPLLKK